MTSTDAGLDEDNWDLNKGKQDCPDGKTYIWIPSVINGKETHTAWWTNYWWNIEPNKGTYVYGGGQFDCCFDPKRFYEQTGDKSAVKLKAFYDEDKKYRPYGPSWVCAELVLGGENPNDRLNQAGSYAIVANAADFSDLGDPKVVLGFFTYQFGVGKDINRHREIDLFETITKTLQGNPGNAQFALQPASADPPTNIFRFEIPKGTSTITAFMTRPGDPVVQVLDLAIFPGDMSISACRKNLYSGLETPKWFKGARCKVNPEDKEDPYYKYYKFVPHILHERMHINLYVFGGNGKTSNDEKRKRHEVTITRFEYHK
jgi:hypothetical protein